MEGTTASLERADGAAVLQSTTEQAGSATHRGLSKARSALAVGSLGFGCFTFVSTELMPVGVLPAMADGLGVSLGKAGFLVTGFAFVVALTAAPLTALVGRLNRKILMSVLLAACLVGNLITFFAPHFEGVLAGRVLVALAIGIFWSTAAATAVQLVEPRNAVRATSVVYGGLSLASVLGIPGGTLLGEHEGWRAVFAALSMLSLAGFVAVTLAIPNVRPRGGASLSALPKALRSGELRAVFGTTGLVMTGNFMAYTYVAPYLEQVVKADASQVSLMLLLYGAAGVVANFAVGPFVARSLRRSTLSVVAALAASLIALSQLPMSFAALIATVLVWGAAYGSLPVLLQTWVFRGADRLKLADAATSIYVGAYNAAIGLGAYVGGLVIDSLGAAPIPGASAAFVVAALILVAFSCHDPD